MSDYPPRLWDFSAALSAISAVQTKPWITSQPNSATSSPPSLSQSVSTEPGDVEDAIDIAALTAGEADLGNFRKVFDFLSTNGNSSNGVITKDQTPLLIPSNSPFNPGKEHKITWISQLRAGIVSNASGVKADLPSTIPKTPSEEKDQKTVTFDDDATAVYIPPSEDNEPDLSHLPKSARKKERRRLRKLAAEDAAAAEEDIAPVNKSFSRKKDTFHATSDADTDADLKTFYKQSMTRRSVIQDLLTPTPTPKKEKKIKDPHDFFAFQVAERYASEPAASDGATPSRGLGRSISAPPPVDLNEIFSKKNKLLSLLSDRFPEDKPALSNLGQRLIPSNGYTQHEGSGIHIFVDMSNILIGFHNAIKIARGLGINARIPRQKLSFFNFSLILERGREATKKCLAGSEILESVEEAVTLGYENNCLDRVRKVKKMTARQLYFAQRDREKSGMSSGGEGYLSGNLGSGADEDAELPMKFVEQGVDEILHLKMMESLVDCEPGTMVLATGDAAEAEYSEGFLRMCERALNKGWKVELVSFRANMSSEYRRKDWIRRWNGNFRVIELDDFAELMRL